MVKMGKIIKKIFMTILLLIIISLLIYSYELKQLKIETLNELEQLNQDYKTEIEELKQGYEDKIRGMDAIDYTPKLSEIIKVVRKDKINEETYEEDDFNCVDFSNGLIQALRDKKIYSCITTLYITEGAHAIVAVNTSDYGLIYIEAQDDTILYSLNVGEDYCEKLNWDCEDKWKITHIKSCFSERKNFE